MRQSSTNAALAGRFFSLRFVKAALALAALQAGFAWSQALPQAGQVNRDAQQVIPAREANPINSNSPLPAPRESLPEAITVQIKGFRFNGNVAISSEELQSLVIDSVNKRLDFAALDRVTDSISRHYRAKGFTVGRAFLPPQQSADGIILINIVEGHFSKVNIKNNSPIKTERLEQTIANNLCSVGNQKDCVGKHVKDEGLERAILIVKDLPGITGTANLKPGNVTGTSELDVEVRETKPRSYSIGFDNYGSPATGTTRLNASADFNNLRNNGDQLSLGFATTTMYNNTKTGSISYSLPIGYEGQRLGVSLARSQYRLGAGFSATRAYGLSNALSVYNSYPIIRSVNRSLYVRGSVEVRGGFNNVDAVGTSYRSSASVARLGISGDHVDGFGGGGYTVYSTTWSGGYVGNSDPTDSSATGAKSAGRFNKLAYSIARQQATVGALTLYSALSGQRGFKNLDGSEQTGLGGPSSTRGYGGEAGGSTGANATVELRYSTPFKIGDEVNNMTYGLFVDRGWVRFYETIPSGTSATTANSRALSSYGLTATLQSAAKIPTPTSWGYFLRGMVGFHSMNEPSTVDATSRRKFWLQGGVNF
jgi:hemolysin activation/secretion protein